MDEPAERKERLKTIWALGEYAEVARRFEGVAQETNFGALIAAREQLGDRYLLVVARRPA
jgi:hypothetical protein